MADELREVGYGKCVLVKADDHKAIGGAIHEIESGMQTDMFFHRTEGKIVYVMMGKIKATVIKDGKMSSMDVGSGNSFYVKPGLVHQITAVDGSAVLIEFGSSFLYDDYSCVFKGTQFSVPLDQEVKEEKVETKKPTTRKKTTRKKTTKKTTKKTASRKRKK